MFSSLTLCIKNKQVDLAMQTLLNVIMFDPNLSNWGRDATRMFVNTQYVHTPLSSTSVNVTHPEKRAYKPHQKWEIVGGMFTKVLVWNDTLRITQMNPKNTCEISTQTKKQDFGWKNITLPPEKKKTGILNHSPKPPQTSPEPALRCTGVAGSPIRHPAGYQHPSDDRWNWWWKQGNSWEWWDEICEVKIENCTHRDFTSLTLAKEYKWIQKSHASNIKRPLNDSKYVSIPV